MNRIATIVFCGTSLLLAGCEKSDVKYSDLKPATTATVDGKTVTFHLGSNLTASACWTHPKLKIEGSTIFITGYRTLKEQNQEVKVELPETADVKSLTVVWIDPDGSHVTVPFAKSN